MPEAEIIFLAWDGHGTGTLMKPESKNKKPRKARSLRGLH